VSDQRWQVAGNAAQAYEQRLVPAIFAAWAPRVLALAAPAPGQRLLDVACGTGVVAGLAAERLGPAGQVAGLDLNPGMLAVAASRPVDGAPTGWVQASAGRLPFPDGSFQVICCQAGLQFLPDRPAALAEMARVLAPGGRLAALVWRSTRGPGGTPGRGRDHPGPLAEPVRPRLPDRRPADQRPRVIRRAGRRRRGSRRSHGDGDLAAPVALDQLPDGLGDLGQRVGRADRWGDLAGLQQLPQGLEVLLPRLGAQHRQPLAHEP
jgi:SAM-dependent methyltransferase